MSILLVKCPKDDIAFLAAKKQLYYTASLPAQQFDAIYLVGKSERIYMPVFAVFGGAEVTPLFEIDPDFSNPRSDWSYSWQLFHTTVFDPPLNLYDYLSPTLSVPEKKLLPNQLHRFEHFLILEESKLLLPAPAEKSLMSVCKPLSKPKKAAPKKKELTAFSAASSLLQHHTSTPPKGPVPLDIRAIKREGHTVQVQISATETREGIVTQVLNRTEENPAHPGVMVLTDQILTVDIPEIGKKRFTASALFALSRGENTDSVFA